MDSLHTFLKVTVGLFVLLTVAHLWRAATGTNVVIGTMEIGPALSWPFAALTAALALWGASLSRAHRRP